MEAQEWCRKYMKSGNVKDLTQAWDVGNLISGSSAFSKSSLNIWKFTAHVLLKPGLENFEPLMRRVDSLEKTLMLEGIRGRRRRG